MNPDSYLSPFLDVIKSDHTNGPVTARAMSAVEKFINYELITANKYVGGLYLYEFPFLASKSVARSNLSPRLLLK